MDHGQCLILLSLLCAASAGSRIGRNCLQCYSGVCSSNTSQLAELITSPPDCCSCFGECTVNGSSTVEALQGLYGNTPLEDCCMNVSRIITNESYVLNKPTNPHSCNKSKIIFHDLSLLNNRQVSQQSEINRGTYIVTHFVFTCNGCIESLLFRVLNESAILYSDTLTFTIYREYDNRGAFSSKLYEAKNHFNVSLVPIDEPDLVKAIPWNAACFESGDVLGFTISSSSSFEIVVRGGVSDTRLYNISEYNGETDCQQLDGLIEDPAVSDGVYDPLMLVQIGPLSPSPSLVPTATSSLLLVPLPTSSVEPTFVTTQSTSTKQAPKLSLPIIIAIAASGCVAIILVFLVLALAICCARRRNRRAAVTNLNSKNGRIGRVVSTMRSQRMDDLLTPQVITVVNKDLDDDDVHDYDIPSELRKTDMTHQVHFYHELENEQKKQFNSAFAESYKYMTMNPPIEQPPEIHQGRAAATGQHLQNISEDYHDPIELKDVDHHIVPNPLYRTGMEANGDMSSYDPSSHYDVPTALMRTQENTPPPIYHVLEDSKYTAKKNGGVPDANIYTETGFNIHDDTPSRGSMFGSQYSLGSTSVDTSTDDPLSPSVQSDTALLPHVYHELEDTLTVVSTIDIDEIEASGRQTPLKLDCGLEGSLGRHRVFEPGIYVPGGDERQHLAVVTQVEISDVYQSWKQKSCKASTKKKEFFEDSVQFWEPKNVEQDIYNQLSEKKFREILRDQIDFSSHLGVGQFGSVCKATWSNMLGGFKKVAVKTLKPTSQLDSKIAFLKEAAIMGQFCHSNVVQLYGVVTVGEPIMIVMELMALGDLDTYLWKNYCPGEKLPPPHVNTLLSFSRQVACGMKYLERKKFVHRDLAARNVLVTETLVCKIGDFGMSRFLKDTNYYASKGGTVPIKWTAPEGLNYKKYSTASDVYSYGMILYEIWSLGLKPLAHVKIQNVSQFVTEGHCQHPPPGCSRRIYEIMVKCWTPDQKYRPTFAEIFETLSGLDSNLLKWFDNDLATLSNLAMQLGAPLKEAKDMFLDLQKRNIIQEEILPYTGNLRTEV